LFLSMTPLGMAFQKKIESPRQDHED